MIKPAATILKNTTCVPNAETIRSISVPSRPRNSITIHAPNPTSNVRDINPSPTISMAPHLRLIKFFQSRASLVAVSGKTTFCWRARTSGSHLLSQRGFIRTESYSVLRIRARLQPCRSRAFFLFVIPTGVPAFFSDPQGRGGRVAEGPAVRGQGSTHGTGRTLTVRALHSRTPLPHAR